ncbi:hypothetical protein [Roseomonas sp. 18066]|uniref:hypothetical protein n=1 Tax=Roseomonas sp. 18066 TaxID=2681412 RepID=UPI001359173E|nr:hypothetical protein [Roseomonas sp. 18066]
MRLADGGALDHRSAINTRQSLLDHCAAHSGRRRAEGGYRDLARLENFSPGSGADQ